MYVIMPRGKTSSKICEFCKKSVSLFSYNRHIKSHNKPIKIKFERGLCKFCNKEYESLLGLKNHEIRCPHNPNRKIQVLTDECRERRRITPGRIWDDASRKRHSSKMKDVVLSNPKSYSSSNVCGRNKIQLFDGEKFHSSWEVEVAKWLKEHNIIYQRDVQPIPYQWKGVWHLYFPDFFIPVLNCYIEVKGYETERDIQKWNSIQNLKVLKEKEINDILDGRFSLERTPYWSQAPDS